MNQEILDGINKRITELTKELDSLIQARKALTGKLNAGRKPKKTGTKGKRTVSAETRRKMSEAAKHRWAQQPRSQASAAVN